MSPGLGYRRQMTIERPTEATPPRSATLIALAYSTGYGYEEWERALQVLGLEQPDVRVLDIIVAMCAGGTSWTPTTAAHTLIQAMEVIR